MKVKLLLVVLCCAGLASEVAYGFAPEDYYIENDAKRHPIIALGRLSLLDNAAILPGKHNWHYVPVKVQFDEIRKNQIDGLSAEDLDRGFFYFTMQFKTKAGYDYMKAAFEALAEEQFLLFIQPVGNGQYVIGNMNRPAAVLFERYPRFAESSAPFYREYIILSDRREGHIKENAEIDHKITLDEWLALADDYGKRPTVFQVEPTALQEDSDTARDES